MNAPVVMLLLPFAGVVLAVMGAGPDREFARCGDIRLFDRLALRSMKY